MTVAIIRKALETQLVAIAPTIATAFENVGFTPSDGVPYQRANLLPNSPEDSTLGSRTYFERGLFQVMLCYPEGIGPGEAEARAQLVKNAFKRGTSLVQAGVTVIITAAPQQAQGLNQDDRYCIPVTMRYQAQITP